MLVFSAASITNSEQVGLGMVADGSKCGERKVFFECFRFF